VEKAISILPTTGREKVISVFLTTGREKAISVFLTTGHEITHILLVVALFALISWSMTINNTCNAHHSSIFFLVNDHKQHM
jgi:hypothetical protein